MKNNNNRNKSELEEQLLGAYTKLNLADKISNLLYPICQSKWAATAWAVLGLLFIAGGITIIMTTPFALPIIGLIMGGLSCGAGGIICLLFSIHSYLLWKDDLSKNKGFSIKEESVRYPLLNSISDANDIYDDSKHKDYYTPPIDETFFKTRLRTILQGCLDSEKYLLSNTTANNISSHAHFKYSSDENSILITLDDDDYSQSKKEDIKKAFNWAKIKISKISDEGITVSLSEFVDDQKKTNPPNFTKQ